MKMEISVILRYLCVCVTLQMVQSDDSYSEWLKMSRRAERRERRKQEENELPEDYGSSLINAKKPKGCCKNGGICIMNSFCHCKKNYYGRHCQHRVKHRPCGTIAHGTWLTAACNICHCYDGRMVCKDADFPNCGDTIAEGHETDPDYNGGIEKQFEEYDKFYDDYETDSTSGAMAVNGLAYWVFWVLVVSLRCLGLVS